MASSVYSGIQSNYTDISGNGNNGGKILSNSLK